MTDKGRFDMAMVPITRGANKSSHEFTNKNGITSEITIDMMNNPSVGLGIKLTGKGINVTKHQQVFAADSNDLYKHYDNLLRETICTVALEDLRPENF